MVGFLEASQNKSVTVFWSDPRTQYGCNVFDPVTKNYKFVIRNRITRSFILTTKWRVEKLWWWLLVSVVEYVVFKQAQVFSKIKYEVEVTVKNALAIAILTPPVANLHYVTASIYNDRP